MAVSTVAWTQLAACRGSERAPFFPPDVTERKEERLAREQMAKRICAACDVREECLGAALDRHESHGVWGGLNELERRSLIRL
jgi:WhiB family transcriptional regulator, redox-sensing transcriptional regulator